MHRVPTARWLSRALRIGDVVPAAGLPAFLCPATGLARVGADGRLRRSEMHMAHSTSRRCFIHTDSATAISDTTNTSAFFDADKTMESEVPEHQLDRKLPVTCSGCGAFAQTTDAQQFGHFDLRSRRVRQWLYPRRSKGKAAGRRSNVAEEDRIVDNVLKSLAPQALEELGLSAEVMVANEQDRVVAMLATEKAPVCDRCHDLTHHPTAKTPVKLAMHHPTVESIRETIEESPYKYNHIYHIIDAADFPMSLIPRLNVLLGDIPLRSRNRRSRSAKFQHDRKTEMSFIITRGDLLGPTKEIVDSMMPYLREVLRDALGRLGGRIRLGNLKCVSARRAWWTTDIKEDVWNRGGAGWMVGKVNVGKSQLFEAIYPKGRMGEGKKALTGQQQDRNAASSTYARSLRSTADQSRGDQEAGWQDLDVGELLPPAQPATNFPNMPLVSMLPGTTASPIRVPFGNGKGELIDLPGLARSNLELYVKQEHQSCLVMKSRIVPEQRSGRSGTSILLGGGLIRITPRTPNMIFLMYNFTPLPDHLTLTQKAIEFQEQTRTSVGVPCVMRPGVGDKMKHAGTFKLSHDVTKGRAGPLTHKNGVNLQVDNLPFRVLSVDILIEGVGYVEIVTQVRRTDYLRWSQMQQNKDKALAGPDTAMSDVSHDDHDAGASLVPASTDKEASSPNEDPFQKMMRDRRDTGEGAASHVKRDIEVPEPDWPAVDVFSPEGRFVGSRRPIQGWLNNKPRVLPQHKRSRPRKSMKGLKKRAKAAKRIAKGLKKWGPDGLWG